MDDLTTYRLVILLICTLNSFIIFTISKSLVLEIVL